MFEQYYTDLSDSMLYDDELIAVYKDESGYTAKVVAEGDKSVWFNDEHFGRMDDFPEELKELFRTSKAYEDERVDVINNNWFAVYIYNANEAEVFTDLVEIEGLSSEELRTRMKTWIDEEIEYEAQQETVQSH